MKFIPLILFLTAAIVFAYCACFFNNQFGHDCMPATFVSLIFATLAAPLAF